MQNDPIVRDKILKGVIKYDEEFQKTGFCIEKPHIYRYDFDYNGQQYHYVGSTIHNQVARAHNNYPKIILNCIKELGVKDFLLKYCTIVKWFDDYIEMTNYEEQLNKELKIQYGDYVLSIGDGRKPTKNCINAAIIQQQKNGSWNKGKHLTNIHKYNSSQRLKYSKKIKENM